MAKVIYPDCGFVHEYESNLDISEIKTNRVLMYGPYARAHNAKGKTALEGG